MRVLIAQDICEPGKDYLRQRGYQVVVSPAFDEDTLKEQIRGCAGVIIRYARFPRTVIEAADQLKVIARHGIGVDNVDLEAATERGIQVTNAPKANANAVAEHTLGVMLALTKHLLKGDKAVRDGSFDIVRNGLQIGDLTGKTLGLIGLGQIGRLVAKKAHLGFDMQIIGHDPYAKDLPDYIRPATFTAVCREADIISLHLPATPETKGLINAQVLATMKPTAILLNMARGSIVVEQDLARALATGVIAAAGVDAFEQEPVPPEHPFLKLDNILLSPHTAALSEQANYLMATQAAQGVDEVLSGKPVTYPVNKLI